MSERNLVRWSRGETMHFEVFAAGVRLPCWCTIGNSHTHHEWVTAGGPNHTGQLDALDELETTIPT